MKRFTTFTSPLRYLNNIASTNSVSDLEALHDKIEQALTEALVIAEGNVSLQREIEASISAVIGLAASQGLPTTKPGEKHQAHWCEALWKAALPVSHRYDVETITNAGEELRSALLTRLRYLQYQDERGQREQLQSRHLVTFGLLAAKWGLPEDIIDPDDILDALLALDKYLDLAWAMHRVREDSSEGFGLVASALNRFTITCEIDREIASAVSKILESDETDGRAFRDCDWSYSEIYNQGNQALRSDILKLRKLRESL